MCFRESLFLQLVNVGPVAWIITFPLATGISVPIVNSGKNWDSSPGVFRANSLSRAVWAKALSGGNLGQGSGVHSWGGDGMWRPLGVFGTCWMGIGHGIFL